MLVIICLQWDQACRKDQACLAGVLVVDEQHGVDGAGACWRARSGPAAGPPVPVSAAGPPSRRAVIAFAGPTAGAFAEDSMTPPCACDQGVATTGFLVAGRRRLPRRNVKGVELRQAAVLCRGGRGAELGRAAERC